MPASLVKDITPPENLDPFLASYWTYFVTNAPATYIKQASAKELVLAIWGAKALAIAERFGKVPENIDPNFSYETLSEEQWNLFSDEGTIVHTGTDWMLMDLPTIQAEQWQGDIIASAGGIVPVIPQGQFIDISPINDSAIVRTNQTGEIDFNSGIVRRDENQDIADVFNDATGGDVSDDMVQVPRTMPPKETSPASTLGILALGYYLFFR